MYVARLAACACTRKLIGVDHAELKLPCMHYWGGGGGGGRGGGLYKTTRSMLITMEHLN